MNSDKAWKYFGKKNPYYGVLTDKKFLLESIDKTKKNAFFKSGQLYVHELIDKIQTYHPTMAHKSMCDFGCGVGRLTLPFADYFDDVVGVDVSQEMLTEGEKAAFDAGKKNIRWVPSDDDLSQLDGPFNLVHSYIVLQHIPVKRGLRLIQLLLQKVTPDGIIAIHIVYSNEEKQFLQLMKRIPLFWYCLNIVRQRPVFEPPMEMNTYPLEKILNIFREAGIKQVNLDITNHGHGGCMLIGQKNTDES